MFTSPDFYFRRYNPGTEVCETNLTQMMDSIFVHSLIISIEDMGFEPVSCIHGLLFGR
jgi:hypothetical protein